MFFLLGYICLYIKKKSESQYSFCKIENNDYFVFLPIYNEESKACRHSEKNYAFIINTLIKKELLLLFILVSKFYLNKLASIAMDLSYTFIRIYNNI